MRRFARIVLWGLAALTGLVVLLAVAGLLTLRTQWFRDRVRDRIVYEIENATGARAELGAFLFDWKNLTAEVRNLVIRGKEGPNEPPLFRADSAQVSFRILSIIKKQVDLYSANVRRPQANIIVFEDGSTNFPERKPPRPRKRDPIQTVLNLAIKRFTVTDGTVQFAHRRMPLNLRGEDLRALISYERAGEPRYLGEVSFRNVAVKPGEMEALPFRVDAKFALARNVLELRSAHLELERSTFDVRGRVDDFANMRARFQYAAHVRVEDISPVLGFRAAPQRGAFDLGGEVALSRASGYALTGHLAASGLAFEPRRGLRLTNVGVESNVSFEGGLIHFHGLTVRALGGRFDGAAELTRFRDLTAKGAVRGFSIEEVTALPGFRTANWTGTISGPVQLSLAVRQGKLATLDVRSEATVAPVPGPNPVEGRISFRYSLPGGNIELRKSYLNTRLSRIVFDGVLGRRLEVSAETTDLEDAESAAELVRAKPTELPVRLLPNGSAQFKGVITSPLKNQVIQGRASAKGIVYEGGEVDLLSADVDVSNTGVEARNIDARKGQVRASGWVRVGLQNWRPEDREPLAGELAVKAPEVTAILAELKRTEPVTGGPVAAKIVLGGTIGAPQVSGNAEAGKLVAWGQPVQSVRAQVRYREGLVEVSPATLQVAGSRVQAAGSYTYPPAAFGEGVVRFDVAARGVQVARLNVVEERSPGLRGRVEAELKGDIALLKSGFRVNAVNGWAAARSLMFEKQELGSLLLAADTIGNQARLTLDGQLAGADVNGRSEFVLRGDYPVRGHVQFTRINFATLIERFRNMPADGLPFEGFAAGRVEFEGVTTKPDSFKAMARIEQLEVRPELGAIAAANAEQMVVRNAGPILADLSAKTAQIRQAVLRGRQTDLTLSGRMSFTSRNPLDLRAQGHMNLALLRDFEPRLSSGGAALLDVSVRGRISRPDIYGRVELKKASFSWQGIPNGIDDANGLVFLYRDRATIDRLTAVTGGGKLAVTGFVGFGADPTFHLSTKAEGVRVRYPEGVSSSATADLTLTGTVQQSLLSGDVTITRVGFNPRSDLAGVLASTAEPVDTPAEPNRFLQGMRLNIHIVTAPEARLETKLTRDIQAEADLRLRGDPTRPVLLGRVLINEGEVLFFGNQYEIQSGQVLFVNASKIEPIVNLDLQTRARGIDVTLHVSGPANRLNVTYQSDPPLQFSEIVALLATGREPAGAGITGSQQPAAQQSWQQAGASAILTQALASPIAGRLQRFFGVSRLKIDPLITGITTNNAAARVTLEQQVTRNLTFTYITDLSRPQAQSVRIEWDFNRNWSAVAQREENGLFGVDFVYKRRFK